MKAEELRIGNLIQIKENFEFRIECIIGIYFHQVLTSGSQEILLTYDKILPIPLTEEWCEKLGFIKNKTFTGVEFQYKNFIVYDNGICVEDTHRHFFKLSEIKYVHQLQNLFFALTGKEIGYEK